MVMLANKFQSHHHHHHHHHENAPSSPKVVGGGSSTVAVTTASPATPPAHNADALKSSLKATPDLVMDLPSKGEESVAEASSSSSAPVDVECDSIAEVFGLESQCTLVRKPPTAIKPKILPCSASTAASAAAPAAPPLDEFNEED
jgi:cell division septation protein DedD